MREERISRRGRKGEREGGRVENVSDGGERYRGEGGREREREGEWERV